MQDNPEAARFLHETVKLAISGEKRIELSVHEIPLTDLIPTQIHVY